MVIQCTKCKTRFKLADNKITPGGIKVRCAKCKHIFKVMPPEPLEETVPPVSTPPEEPTAERQEEKLPGELAETAAAEKEAAAEPAPEQEKPPEISEFSFEQEESSGPTEFSFEEEGETSLEGNPELSWDEATEPTEEFDIGEKPEGTLETEEFDLSEMAFSEEEAEQETTPVSQHEEKEAVKAAESNGASEETPAGEVSDEKTEPQPAAPPQPHKSPFNGLMIFILVLLIALAGIAGYFFWQGEKLDVAQMISRFTGEKDSAPVAGQIRLKDVSSLFVTNQEAGQLFVIQGQASNEFPDTRSAIEIKGVLRDQKGKPLLQQTVFCGNPIEEKDLQGLPFAQIEERMNNQFGDSLSNLNIAPGTAIPFTIVFKNLPEDMAEFTVEVADSRPGSK